MSFLHECLYKTAYGQQRPPIWQYEPQFADPTLNEAVRQYQLLMAANQLAHSVGGMVGRAEDLADRVGQWWRRPANDWREAYEKLIAPAYRRGVGFGFDPLGIDPVGALLVGTGRRAAEDPRFARWLAELPQAIGQAFQQAEQRRQQELQRAWERLIELRDAYISGKVKTDPQRLWRNMQRSFYSGRRGEPFVPNMRRKRVEELNRAIREFGKRKTDKPPTTGPSGETVEYR